jgi:hypothetical protein
MFNKLILISLLPILFGITSLAAVDLSPRPVKHPRFTAKRVFYYDHESSAIPLDLSFQGEAYVFEEAVSSCGLDLHDAQLRLAQILNFDESRAVSSLRKIYPDLDGSRFSNLRILVDNFGDSARIFRSYFLSSQKGEPATIVLDCQTVSRDLWAADLSHELVHYLNQGRGLSHWMDEMLAQLVEVENSGRFPFIRVQQLTGPVVPGFFTDINEVTFQSSQQYAVNLLFGLYLKKLFGDEVLSVLNSSVENLDQLSEKLAAFVDGKARFNWLRPLITPTGLIRHFQLALSINAPVLNGGPVFQVPQWAGFSSGAHLASRHDGLVIPPGGSLRLSSSELPSLHGLPADVDAYRILKSGVLFKIIDLKRSSESVSGVWTEDFLLLVNTSSQRSFTLGKER